MPNIDKLYQKEKLAKRHSHIDDYTYFASFGGISLNHSKFMLPWLSINPFSATYKYIMYLL